MASLLGRGEHAWHLLLPGERVRILDTARPEAARGATGVLGVRFRSDPSRPPARHHVRVVAPPEAVADFPHGVYLPITDLAAEGDGGDGDSRDEAAVAEFAARAAAEESLRMSMVAALGLSGTHEACNHGSCIGTTALMAAHQTLMSVISDGAPFGDVAGALRAARTWVREHPGVVCEALRRRCAAVAIDALIGDGPPCPPEMLVHVTESAAAAVLAVGEAMAAAGGASSVADAAEVAAQSLSSPLRVRRTLAAACACHCLRVCAAPGCGAKRARGTEARGDTAGDDNADDAPRAPLLACGACRAVYYCCAEHQRSHWPRHKRECRELAAPAAAAADEQARPAREG